MFNENKNIKVGRDININIEKSNLEKSDQQELIEKKKDANLILKKETNRKFKSTFNFFVFAVILFFIIYLLIPFLLNKYGNEENWMLSFITKITQNEKTILVLSGFASFMAILTPLNDLWKSNDIEKKQHEILKSINTILKEREYLKK